jgi:hypothetical protein
MELDEEEIAWLALELDRIVAAAQEHDEANAIDISMAMNIGAKAREEMDSRS